MSTTNFYTPGFMRKVSVRLGQPLSPLVTGRLADGGQIETAEDRKNERERLRRELVLDRERERSHYFDGKLLKAQDLLRDQNYLDARLRQAGRAFGAGILAGLRAALVDGWVEIGQGVAISPSGRVLELKDAVLRAPVDDAALRAALNQGRYGYLSSGLYLLLLSWHEQPGNAIAEVYPRQAGDQPQAQPDAYEQGVKLELMATGEALSLDDELDARAALAERFLQNGAEFPGMPAESVALGLLAVRDNLPLWLDGTLVRRYQRWEREPHAEPLRRAAHYEDLLDDLVRRRHRNEAFELSRYFRRIPAMGPLPNAFVDPRNQGFKGFPDHYQVELVPVRAEDIGFVREQAAHLPPLNLADPRSERVQILVPLDSAAFEGLAAALDGAAAPTADTAVLEAAVDSAVGSRATRIPLNSFTPVSAIDRLAVSRLNFRLPRHIPAPLLSAWEIAFATLPAPLGLYYVREFQLAAIQAPQVLPISAGFPAPATAEPPPPEVPETPPPPDPPVLEPGPPLLKDIVRARGSSDPLTLEIIDGLTEAMLEFEELFRILLPLLDNAYDRFFWLTLSKVDDRRKFLELFIRGLQRGMMPVNVVEKSFDELGIDPSISERWIRLAELLGDGR